MTAMSGLTVLVGVLAALLGVVIGVVGAWSVVRARRARATPEAEPVRAETVPSGVADVVAILRSAAIVIGSSDSVLLSTVPARNLGLVRGSRVVVDLLLELAREARDTGEIRTADLELRRGQRAPSAVLSVRVAPVQDLVIILAEDRTQARRVEETRRDFVANVSHELKTPIGAIALLAEAVEDAADDPAAIRRFASRMQVESQRLSELVASIIELSRVQADEPMTKATSVDVDALLQLAADRRRVDADRRGIALVIGGERGLTVRGDAEQLTVAVANLVENAVIYSEADGRVVLSARRVEDAEEDVVEISVSDSGVGIEPAELHRIFERFYRVDYARSRDNGGTGLGLAIVKHIAGAHGGDVTVWSRPGQGSTFTLRLPHHAEDDDAAAGAGLVQSAAVTREVE